jgi:transcriptional regulator with XRE-family HTH domain
MTGSHIWRFIALDIGKRVKLLRMQAGLSTTALARLTGYTQSHISKVESGDSKPSLDLISRICSALNITLADFFASAGEGVTPLPPRLRKILESAEKLSPEQLQLAQRLLDDLVEFQKYQVKGSEKVESKTEVADDDVTKLVLVASSEGREEMKPASPELQQVIRKVWHEVAEEKAEANSPEETDKQDENENCRDDHGEE